METLGALVGIIALVMFITEFVHIVRGRKTVGRWWPIEGEKW